MSGRGVRFFRTFPVLLNSMPYLFYSLARFSWRKESLTLPLSITCFMVNKGCSWIYLRFNPLVPQFLR